MNNLNNSFKQLTINKKNFNDFLNYLFINEPNIICNIKNMELTNIYYKFETIFNKKYEKKLINLINSYKYNNSINFSIHLNNDIYYNIKFIVFFYLNI